MIDELRKLIVDAAPDPAQAQPVMTCDADQPLDAIIPFSSVIVLGVVVAVEDTYGVQVTKAMMMEALAGGVTLRKLANMLGKTHR